MPAFPLHGWMPDAYRAAPLPVLALLSGVLSKVGAYGFLRIVLPLYPGRDRPLPGADPGDRARRDPLRLGDGVHADERAPRSPATPRSPSSASSPLGIFSLRPDGADGAVLQMVNHGLVVGAVFFIVALLCERAGTDDLADGRPGDAGAGARGAVPDRRAGDAGDARLGQLHGRVPHPPGVFQAKIVFAFVAAIGVVLAAFYMIRLYQRSMHNRLPEGVESREIGLRDAAVLTPLVA